MVPGLVMPAPTFAHVRHMSDARGIFEHALGTSPRYECGYCLDDVARALVVVCREQLTASGPSASQSLAPRPSQLSVAELERLAATYFQFVARAQGPDGSCHNRLGLDGHWQDEPTTGDWWGRALWGLGTAAARSSQQWIRDAAVVRFDFSATRRSQFPHAMSFAALGATELLSVRPEHGPAVDLLRAAVDVIGRPDFTRSWPWPLPRLSYANAAIAEALIAAGATLGDDTVLADGLGLLGWLLDVETRDGHLSVTPSGGWVAGEARPGYDQQPIEAAAIADACARAFDVTGDNQWSAGLGRAIGWFLGDNDGDISLYDEVSGGGFDALTPGGRNTNQGAESTLAMVSALQHGRRLALVAR